MTPQHLEDELRAAVEDLQIAHAQALALCHLTPAGVEAMRRDPLVPDIAGRVAQIAERLLKLSIAVRREPLQHETEELTDRMINDHRHR